MEEGKNMPSLDLTNRLAEEYEHLFSLAKIRPEYDFEVNAAVTRIFKPENLAA